MILASLMLTFLLLPDGVLHAQRCDGTINIRVSDSTSGTNVFGATLTVVDSTGDFFTDHLASRDGRFTISAYRRNAIGTLMSHRSLMSISRGEYLTFYFGCDGDYMLCITRRGSNIGDTDTMNIYLDDVCDEKFSMNLTISPGMFRAQVCDSTARDLERGGDDNQP